MELEQGGQGEQGVVGEQENRRGIETQRREEESKKDSSNVQ